MKYMSYLLFMIVLSSFVLAGYDDGKISAGEYEYFVEWFTTNPPLIIEGGGANIIEMRNSGLLEVQSTSIPVNDNWHTGGIRDIVLFNYSHLDYLGGSTEEITIGSSATAKLYGGRIDYITSMQHVTTPRIDLYCQPDYEWIKTGDLVTRITGHWLDGSRFDIELINDDNYDETWTNINIMPESTTLALLGLGGLILRRGKR